jgi:hypothetical protein
MHATMMALGGGAGAGAAAGHRAPTSLARLQPASAPAPFARRRPLPIEHHSRAAAWAPRPAKVPRRPTVATAAGGDDSAAADPAPNSQPPTSPTPNNVTSHLKYSGRVDAPRPPGMPLDRATGLPIHPSQPEGWWEGRITRESARGPPGDEAPWGGMPNPRNRDEGGQVGMGEQKWREYQNMRRLERQRAWDALRREAERRWEAGGRGRGSSLPAWYRPGMLDRVVEHPANTFLRQLGYSDYQVPEERGSWIARGRAVFSEGDARAAAAADAAADRALEEAADTGDGGGTGGGINNNGSGGGGAFGWMWRRWWREDDPYWPLRDWGDHPLRWWVVALGLFFLVGGMTAPLKGGDSSAAYLAASALLTCGSMMSDMRHDWLGHVGVKAAWCVCVAVAAFDFACGWRLGPFWSFPYAADRPSPWPRLLKLAFGFEESELPRWLGGGGGGGGRSGAPPAAVRGVPASQRGAALDAGCDPATSFPDVSELPLNHRPPQLSPFSPGSCALAIAALCMVTDMGGLSGDGTSIPENPGGVFKVDSVRRKNRAWEYWGYGHMPMGAGLK